MASLSRLCSEIVNALMSEKSHDINANIQDEQVNINFIFYGKWYRLVAELSDEKSSYEELEYPPELKRIANKLQDVANNTGGVITRIERIEL